ncbi:MAG: response regulator [Planctomycetota bacterium]
MLLGFDFSSPPTGHGQSMTHSLLEWTGVCAALMVGILAFLHYRLNEEPSLPIIGLAMLGAAGMDIFHTLAADGLVADVVDMENFIPYTWIGSRLFAGLISLVGVGMFVLWRGPNRRIRNFTFGIIGLSIMGSAWFLMHYSASSPGLPRTLYAENFIKRPLDLYPLAIYLTCGFLVFPAYYRNHPSPFALALILSTIPQCATQLYMALGSTELYDSAFNIAHAMKAMGYLVPAGGLLAELHMMFQSERKMRRKFESARREAEIATRSKSEFLASITQEIRTPMTGVIGMAKLLKASDLDEQQQDATDVITGSANAVLALVEDVQDFSRLESGSVNLEKKSLDPRRLMDGVLELLTIQANQHNVDLSGFVTPEVPNRILGDEVRLRQILIKLAANALRHTRDGDVNLLIELVEEDGKAAVLRFHVRDTGAGMPEDKRVRILRSFSQPGQEDGHEFGGNGLGLAVTRQIVRLMGGSIWVESKLGEGTSFCFTVTVGSDLPQNHFHNVVEEWQGRRILLAEGNPLRAEQLTQQFSAWGFHVTTAADGWDAIREIRASVLLKTPFDMAVLSEDLPGQSGMMLCRQIRATKNSGQIKLVLRTKPDGHSRSKEFSDRPWDFRLRGPVRHNVLHNIMLKAYGIAIDPPHTEDAGDFKTAIAQYLGLRVLVAEDDPVNSEMISKLLGRLGCRVDQAQNGEDAVKRMAERSYDIVFMDCQMPIMDGYEATRIIRFREEEADQHTIIVAMTPNANMETRELVLRSGMDDYMCKPVSSKVLLETLNRWKVEELCAR